MQSSIVSYKNRGNYGNSSWRGNTSGRLLVDLFNHYRPEFVVDPAEGGGTTRDVCSEMQIAYKGFDLHSGFNLLRTPLASRLDRKPDFIFYHPPYWDMVKYSGEVWGVPHPDDLSRAVSVEDFLGKLELSLMNIYDALQPQGKYAVLVGDQRKRGEYFSFQADIIAMGVGKLRDMVIKAQHNCVSDRRSYSGTFIPIQHEYCLVFEKEKTIVSIGVLAARRTVKMSRAFYGTWKNVVMFAMQKMGGQASLSDLYGYIEDNVATQGNNHVRAKIRQVVQMYFERLDKGVYGMRPAAAA